MATQISTEACCTAFKRKGYDDEILRQSGLFLADEVHGMQDKFWNRVIYPIMDANSRVIGFGGRVMGMESRNT